MTHSTLFITLLSLCELTLYSDKTERGGETEAEFVEKTNDYGESQIEFSGILKGIELPNGNKVGFAGLRFPLKLSNTHDKISISFIADPLLVVRANLKTKYATIPNVEGDLTYQAILTQDLDNNSYSVHLSDLKPVVRGREFPIEQAPLFIAEDVLSFAIELKLSEQLTPNAPTGVPFQLIFPQ